MLQTLHNKAAGFFVKILIGLLVASFAVWGIGDIFRSSPGSAIVSVGEGGVSVQEFKEAFDKEAANYRRMLGDQYSPELIKSIGMPTQVLEKLIQQHLVEEEVAAQGLVTPDSYLMSTLRDTPSFKGEDGKFNARQFKTVLANNGMNEQMYLALLSKEVGADMLLQSVFSGLQATDTAAKLAYQYENEKRTVDVLIFKPELITNIAEPSAVELERYYEETADNFKAQEYRVFSMVALDVDTMLKDMPVSDEDMLMEYQNRIDEFQEPEKREVKQLLFDDEATAAKAAAALDGKKDIETVAKEFGATNSALLLGTVTKSGVLPEAEEQIFGLQSGGHTKPIQSSFGWHVFQVTKIEPERTLPLAEVKEQLALDMRTQHVGNEVYELSNTLQDDLAGGATLEEAAKSIGSTVKTYGPIDADGNSPDGTKVSLPEAYPNLLADAFSMPANQTSNLMENEGGSYYAINVDSVLPERTRALDEIKGTVVDNWKETQRGKNLYQLASGISSTLGNENIRQVADKTGAKLLNNQTLTRSSTSIGDNIPLPSMMLTAIFSAQADAATEAFALPDGSYVVAKLDKVAKADPSSKEGKAATQRSRDSLRAVYADELYLQYMAYLRKKHGVSEPNHAMIDSLLQ